MRAHTPPELELDVEADSSALLTLIEALRAVDTTDPLAALNATTITDNNGGRIEL